MTLLDVILLIMLFGFVFYGLFFGLVQTLGGLVGVFAGAIIASRLFEQVGQWLKPLFWGNAALSKIICFIILFILINRLAGLVFHIVDRIFGFLKIIPFLKSINSILGGLIGFLEGAFLLGGIIYIAARYPVFDWLSDALAQSVAARYLSLVFNLISPLLPMAVRQIQSLF
jgi:uncharacterized membrane protein required for colicin V production